MKILTSAIHIGEKCKEMISHVRIQINTYSKCKIITAINKVNSNITIQVLMRIISYRLVLFNLDVSLFSESRFYVGYKIFPPAPLKAPIRREDASSTKQYEIKRRT
jgi:hypothetical protein